MSDDIPNIAPSIMGWRENDECFTEEGCFILELHNGEEDEHLSVARARVIPGVTTRWHRLHGVTERYLILEGNGVVEIGGNDPCSVACGDTVLIPPFTPQRITNTGAEDLVFLALCTPRFTMACYESL